jgi:hypothetical protein
LNQTNTPIQLIAIGPSPFAGGLRNIKSNRLKWWPVNQCDLRDLIDMGLVEMHDDAPALTNAGLGVIS